jgi:hypothetical protein
LGIDFGSIYRKDKEKVRKFYLQEIIRRAFGCGNSRRNKKRISKPEIHRRNTGYAVDILLKSDLFFRYRTYQWESYFVCGSGGYFTSTIEVT